MVESRLLCDPNSIDAFFAVIEQLYNSPALCDDMTVRAKQSALPYDFQVINKGMCSIYEQLMGDNADPEK